MALSDVFSFFDPGKFKVTPQQSSGGLVSSSLAGLSSSVRSGAAQDTANAASTPIPKGDGNPLGLPPINWQTLTNSVGDAQNLVNSTSQNAGNGLATAAANFSGSAVGSLSSAAASSLFMDPATGKPTSPMAGAMAGALSGSFISKGVASLVGSEVTKLVSGINLKPVQKILGTTLGLLTKAKDTFGFLFPTPPDYQDIALSGRLAQPYAKDGDIVYKTGAPFIPTLSHQKIVWQTPGKGEGPVTAVRKGVGVASRMSFTLAGRKTVMSLMVNPKQLQVSRSNVMAQAVSRTGFIVNPTGPGEFDVTVSGVTAGMYEAMTLNGKGIGGLSPRESHTVAYSNLLFLYQFFLNNGYIFDDEQKNKPMDGDKTRTSQFTAPSPADAAPPVQRINSMSYVTIEWQKWMWWGFFKSFKIIDTADNPYTLNYEFTFRVCHESDSFKIDNSRADAKNTPPVTGHVTDGYSAERTLAARVLANDNPPSVYQGVTVKHQNAILSDVMFSDDSPTSALNPTVSLANSAKRLSVGGYNLTAITGPSGMRFFGQSPDGTSVDLSGMDNQRAITVVAPGSSPVHYASVAQDGTDAQGNPQVTGVVKVSPGDQPYSYSMPGVMADGAAPITAPAAAQQQANATDNAAAQVAAVSPGVAPVGAVTDAAYQQAQTDMNTLISRQAVINKNQAGLNAGGIVASLGPTQAKIDAAQAEQNQNVAKVKAIIDAYNAQKGNS